MALFENRESVVYKITAWVTTMYKGDWQAAFNAYATNGLMTEDQMVNVLAVAGVGTFVTRGYIAHQAMQVFDATGKDSITFADFNSIAQVKAARDADETPKTAMSTPSPAAVTGTLLSLVHQPGNSDSVIITVQDKIASVLPVQIFLVYTTGPGQLRVNNRLVTFAEFLQWYHTTKNITVTVHPKSDYFRASFLTEFTS